MSLKLVKSQLGVPSSYVIVNRELVTTTICIEQVVRGSVANDRSINHNCNFIAELLSLIHTVCSQDDT